MSNLFLRIWSYWIKLNMPLVLTSIDCTRSVWQC